MALRDLVDRARVIAVADVTAIGVLPRAAPIAALAAAAAGCSALTGLDDFTTRAPLPQGGSAGAASVGGATSTGGKAGAGGAGGCSYRDVVLADSPVAYWQLGEPAGSTTANDQQGTYAGSYFEVDLGAPALVACSDGDAAATMMTSAAGVTFGDVLSFDGQTPFTVEAWVLPDAACDGHAVSKMDGTDGWTLRVAGADNMGGFVGFRRLIVGVGEDAYASVPSGPVHLVGRYDPGSVGAEVCLFVNGMVSCDLSPSALRTVADPLEIGRNAYLGAIDEVAIYAHALADERIAEHLATGTP